MANVVLVEHGNGDVSIGADIGDAFVPFASVSAARIASLQERARDLRQRQESGDEEDARRVRDAIVQLPISSKAKDQPASESEGEGGRS